MRSVWFLALAATGSAAVAQAQGGGLEDAQHDAVQAFDSYLRDDFESAAGLYERSLGAAHHRSVVFDLARLYATKLRSDGSTKEYCRRYLGEGSGPNDADRSAWATAELKAFAKRAREQSPHVPPFPDAEPGVAAAQPKPAMSHADPLRRGSGRPQLLVSAVSAATGITALGVGAGLSVLASRYADAAHDVCNGETCWSKRGIEATSSGRRIAHAATAMLIGGGALSALGVTLFLVRRQQETRTERGRVDLRPFASTSSAGATMEGHW